MKEVFHSPAFIKLRKAIGVLIPLAFAVYNGVLGFLHSTIWNISIFGYYLLLFFIKLLLTVSDSVIGPDKALQRRKIYIVSFVILLIINLALVAPGVFLIRNQKIVKADLIISIVMAVYAFYSVSISIYNLVKVNKTDNLLNKQLTLVSFVNAIVSIIVLQNTLINVNGGMDEEMKTLSSVTTFTFIAILIFITIFSFVKNMKKEQSL